jgi:hypothetical protein
MTIGMTFPVKGDEKIKSVPWGLVEPFRQDVVAAHGTSLERLYALGGLSIAELAKLTHAPELPERE